MGDGDGGDIDAGAIAQLPVAFGSETVLEVAGDPGEDALPFVPGGDGVATARERDEEFIDLTWIEPDTASGT